MYKHIPSAAPPQWNMCDRCFHPKIEIFNHKHSDLCDYFYFRNVEAPSMGYESIREVKDTYYLKTMFEIHNVPHRAFHISGIAGHYWDIFLPIEISGLIDIYNLKEGYAGMSLEDYITTIISPEAK